MSENITQKIASTEQKGKRIGKRSSIAKTVFYGLTVLVIVILMLSSLAFFGFFSFNKMLTHFANDSIPEIMRGARVAGLGQQLLYETGQLSDARSGSEMRIAYKSTLEKFDQIEDLISSQKLPNNNRLKRELVILRQTLGELANFVNDRITITKKTDSSLENLYNVEKELIHFDQHIRQAAAGDGVFLNQFSSWMSKALEITNYSESSASIHILYKIKRAEQHVRREYAVLEELSEDFPYEMQVEAWLMEAKIGRIILRNQSGLISLVRDRMTVLRKTASRGNFTRSLVSEFETANATLFSDVVGNVSKNTLVLSRQVKQLMWCFAIFSFLALSASVTVLLYIRRNLTNRLISLNNSILAGMAGEKIVMQDKGNDEISDMARSFEFYVEEVVIRENKLIKLATQDSLTGVSNRRSFLEQGSKELARAKRSGNPVTFFMMDLDHFKTINDTLGHHTGDEVLKEISKICMDTLREVDLFGRIGGEEFAALLPDTDLSEGLVVAERLRESIETSEWFIDGSTVSCSVSIGVAQSSLDDISLNDLMKRSDAALYVAKNKGRNQCRVAHVK